MSAGLSSWYVGQRWLFECMYGCGLLVDITYRDGLYHWSEAMDAHCDVVHRHPPIKPNRTRTHRRTQR